MNITLSIKELLIKGDYSPEVGHLHAGLFEGLDNLEGIIN